VRSFTNRQLKIAGSCLLAIPVTILAAFTIGEVAAGDISGLQHVAQLAPLVALAWLAWRRPVWGGAALIAGAVLFAGLYFVFMHGFSPAIVILTVVVLFGVPLMAGMLFIAAGREEQSTIRSAQ
jgi:hypothetical protein